MTLDIVDRRTSTQTSVPPQKLVDMEDWCRLKRLSNDHARRFIFNLDAYRKENQNGEETSGL